MPTYAQRKCIWAIVHNSLYVAYNYRCQQVHAYFDYDLIWKICRKMVLLNLIHNLKIRCSKLCGIAAFGQIEANAGGRE
jgi:hypothetical protein